MINSTPLVKNKKIEDTTIAVAMSGGVDSSVVAALLKKQGYKVIGITLKLWDYGPANDDGSKGTCCSQEDVNDARKICENMGVEHYVIQDQTNFKTAVIDDFINTYCAGATPVPCGVCNKKIKFKTLTQKAKELGADALATGHYVQKEWNEELGKYILLRGKDEKKDQSYFLFNLSQEQLDFAVYPLGMIKSKDITRQMAEELGLHISKKPDSQDICFVPDGNYRKVIQQERPEVFKTGNFINTSGKVLGQHSGIVNFTVGQRKGLGITLGYPIYVIELRPATNEVVLGTKEELKVREFNVKELNWLGEEIPTEGLDCQVRVRNGHAPINCRIILTGQETAKVELFNPEAMVAPGQAAVFYTNTRMLGGGWILNNTTKINVTID